MPGLRNAGPILIVEGTTAALDACRSVLRGAGYRTVEAASGSEAARVAHDVAPRAILVAPQGMRAVSSGELALLRTDPLASDIPIIVLGAEERPEPDLDSRTVCLPSPCSPQRLLEELRYLTAVPVGESGRGGAPGRAAPGARPDAAEAGIAWRDERMRRTWSGMESELVAPPGQIDPIHGGLLAATSPPRRRGEAR